MDNEERWQLITVFVVLVVALAGPSIAIGEWFEVFSTFDDDTVGSQPSTGGVNQPTAIINGGVSVEASANGIMTQPLVVDDGSCNPSYFGGVYYDLPSPVTSGMLRVEATVSFNQVTDSVFFDTAISSSSLVATRLYIDSDGTIHDYWGEVIYDYSPNSPIRFRADIDMDTETWACTIDDELDGFGDDPVVSGMQFASLPGNITEIGSALFSLYEGSSACSGSRVVAYDDILITTRLDIFLDGFESGDTSAWSGSVP